MTLDALSITCFKNIAEARLEFSPRLNCFVGNNAMGKSNLLDAVHYLSFCRSFMPANDAELIRLGDDFLSLRAKYTRRGNPLEITLGIARNRRKSLRRDSKEYKRIADHIGLLPLVMASPADIDLIRDSGAERRRWIDMVASMGDPLYLDALMRYNRALEQRNKLLRDHSVDHLLYDVVEHPLAIAAATVVNRRIEIVSQLNLKLKQYYNSIAGLDENPSIAYSSNPITPDEFLNRINTARRHDEIVGHTSVGPHRDDILMSLNDLPVRRAASQGQCKTFAIALRLAQFDFLDDASSVKPLLLLDDIFDKLDSSRVERIMALVGSDDDRFGQIFITDTNRDHLDDIVSRLSQPQTRLWTVSNGVFNPANK